jgi:hypothetical protein
MMRKLLQFFFLCREHDERDQSLRAVENMCMDVQDFISYKIVRTRGTFTHFNCMFMCFPSSYIHFSSCLLYDLNEFQGMKRELMHKYM